MIDRKGRVWMTSKIARDPRCARSIEHQRSRVLPLNFTLASAYSIRRQQFRLIDTVLPRITCSSIRRRPDVYFNGCWGRSSAAQPRGTTHGDEQATRLVSSSRRSNGDGNIRAMDVSRQLADPRRDTEVRTTSTLCPRPSDNSVWAIVENTPGYILRVDRGDNPPETW